MMSSIRMYVCMYVCMYVFTLCMYVGVAFGDCVTYGMEEAGRIQSYLESVGILR